MLTPQQVKNHRFQLGSRGTYRAEEVDAFVQELTASFEEAYTQNEALLKKISLLADKVEEYRRDEDTIRSALLVAQRTADQVVREAKEKADACLAGAENRAKALEEEANARSGQVMQEASDRAQTLTAVNGMMLLAGQGERFTTVDLFLLDLWTGKASLDKLGAAGSYLMQAEGLSLLGGDALPLGILENVESGEKLMQLHQGDTLILLSDGVEDAYENRQSMEEAIRDALTLETAQDAANAILTGAQSGDTAPADDQTVLVLRLIRARADAKIEEMYQ